MTSTASVAIRWCKASSVLLAMFAACDPSRPPAHLPADLLLTGGSVVTLDSRRPHAEAVATRDGAIVCVGSSEDCRPHVDAATHVVDLGGRTVVPGFADSHLHLSGVGFREMELNLEGARSLDDLLAALAKRVASARPGDWVSGRGWIEAQWDPPVFPTAVDLDRVSPDNPVYLVRADGHAGVANSLALQLAYITRQTKPPAGGSILRDVSGQPNGMLIDRAQQLVRQHMPQPTPAQRRQALVQGARSLAAKGWTQVSIAGTDWDEIEQIERLIEAGQIGIRVYAAVSGPGENADRLLRQGLWIRPNNRLTVRGVKLFMDGALGSRGAALQQPYSDDPSTSGLLMYQPDDLRPLLEQALRKGVQVQMHAIGDRANRVVLDLYEQAFAAVPASERADVEPRWRIEHAQILSLTDIPRFAALGVIPSMQASHAITDLHFAPSRLGPARLAGAYAWRSLVDAGSKIAGGSDAPVERGDPLVEIYAAAVRKDLDGFSNEDWRREQRLTREEALRTLTSWAALATFEEDRRGTIEVGKWADFTVLSDDPLQAADEALPSIRVMMTIVGGRVIYEAAAR